MKFAILSFFFVMRIHQTLAGYLQDRGLGTDCVYDEDCLTRNSFCKGNKICTCKIGYQYDAGSDVCFPKEVNLKCTEDYDCSALTNAKCINGYCKCRNDYVPSSDKSGCLPSMRITSVCEENSQCTAVMNRSYCHYIKKQCLCDRGLRRDPYRMECVEQAKLHSPCFYTEDCESSDESKGRVECRPSKHLTTTCECRAGFIEINDVCYSGTTQKFILPMFAIISFILTVNWIS